MSDNRLTKEAVTCAIRHIGTGIYSSRKVLAVRSCKKQESRQFIFQRLLEAGIDPDCADVIVAGLDSDIDTCKMLYEASFGEPQEDSAGREDEYIKLARMRGYSLEVSRSAFRQYLDR